MKRAVKKRPQPKARHTTIPRRHKSLTYYVILFLFISEIVFFCYYLFTTSSRAPNVSLQTTQEIVPTIHPSEVKHWKPLTLLNNTVQILYPDSIYLGTLHTDNFAVALPYKNANVMQFGGFLISAQFHQQDENFLKAVSETDTYFSPYTNVRKTVLPNGVIKYTGTLRDTIRIIGLVNYNGKAIRFDYSSQNGLVSPEVFNQILSSFKIIHHMQPDASNWKLYTNDSYNISFLYPPTFRVSAPRSSNAAFGEAIVIDADQTDGQPERWMNISIVKKTDIHRFLSLSVLQSFSDDTIHENPPTITRLPDENIGGITALVFEANKGWEVPSGPIRIFVINKNSMYYKIFVTYSDTASGLNQHFVTTIHQILESVKFTK